MKKIVLFGGTFDPPHNGHMHLLREAIRAVQPDLVLVMPTGVPPHKNGGHTPGALRARMCKCFLPLAPRGRIRIDETELRRGGRSYTVNTLRILRRRYAGAQFYLPMGSDMLLSFHEWFEYRAILSMATLAVLCRDDDDIAAVRDYEKVLEAEGGSVLCMQGAVMELSSTEIRARAAQGLEIAAFVPQNVAQIVAQHHLYTEAEC